MHPINSELYPQLSIFILIGTMVAVAGGTIELLAECKWVPLVPEEGPLGLQLKVCVLKVIFKSVTHCVRIPPHRNSGTVAGSFLLYSKGCH